MKNSAWENIRISILETVDGLKNARSLSSSTKPTGCGTEKASRPECLFEPGKPGIKSFCFQQLLSRLLLIFQLWVMLLVFSLGFQTGSPTPGALALILTCGGITTALLLLAIFLG